MVIMIYICRERVIYIYVPVLLCKNLFINLIVIWCVHKSCSFSDYRLYHVAWWRHQIETFSVLLVLCTGNSLVTGEFPSQRPVTRSFDVFFYRRLKKRLSKHSWSWWFETLSRPVWRHCKTRPVDWRPAAWPDVMTDSNLKSVCTSLLSECCTFVSRESLSSVLAVLAMIQIPPVNLFKLCSEEY